jgi:hypothetical protein
VLRASDCAYPAVNLSLDPPLVPPIEQETTMIWLRVFLLAALSISAGLPGRANADVAPPDEGCDCSIAAKRTGSAWLLGGAIAVSAALFVLRRRHRL